MIFVDVSKIKLTFTGFVELESSATLSWSQDHFPSSSISPLYTCPSRVGELTKRIIHFALASNALPQDINLFLQFW